MEGNQIQIFEHPMFGQLRSLKGEDGEIWFVARDVATILGYSAKERAIRNHVDKEDKGVNESFTPGGRQPFVLINESGLYSLILSSKLPLARQFKRWVFP